MSGLVLSLFPGIDLLGRGFEAEGFCVVRGPDLLFGGDIRGFNPPAGRFDGVIAGSPCQDFSRARRRPPTGYGRQMLEEFARCVSQCRPAWWMLENVPGVPDVSIPGYTVQRLDINARECGSTQNRHRHIQFGDREGRVIVPARSGPCADWAPAVLATEGARKGRRGWADVCELQGLPRSFELPGLTQSARYAAVGNGVHVAVARTLARAVIDAYSRAEAVRLCACQCGRIITGRQVLALPSCRKRMERRRKRHQLAGAGQATY